MKSYRSTTACFSLFLALLLFSCNSKPIAVNPTAKHKLRVLGYLPGGGDWMGSLNQVDLSKITDLNLAFINPDENGNFPDNDEFDLVVRQAHLNNVRVFFSLGGGSPPAHLETLLKDDRRDELVRAIHAFTVKYNFDGVDIDLENSLINEHYPNFIFEVASAVKPANKLMTAALASWNSNLIHDTTINKFDFINIMSYDKTGPWNLNRPGPHSPFSMVQDDFTYYNKTRSIPAEKLFIGLPFYGYGFGSGAPQSMTYRDIVNTYPGAELQDSIVMPAGGKLYYNGIPTIRQKVLFAAENKAGGVMIWQLKGDINGEKSLLNAIR